jgi:hypothetical protein
MDVEFFGLVDVFTDALEDDGFEEALRGEGCAGNEDFGRFVAGVGGPFVGAGYAEDVFPVRDGGEDLEGFGELAGFVAGEEKSNSTLVG